MSGGKTGHTNNWRAMLSRHIKALQELTPSKPVILAADLNGTRENIDTVPRLVNEYPCCTPDEKKSMQQLLQGRKDVYRSHHPKDPGHTIRPFKGNLTIRLDYIIVPDTVQVIDTYVDRKTNTSDHYPLYATLNLETFRPERRPTKVTHGKEYSSDNAGDGPKRNKKKTTGTITSVSEASNPVLAPSTPTSVELIDLTSTQALDVFPLTSPDSTNLLHVYPVDTDPTFTSSPGIINPILEQTIQHA